MDRRSFLKLGAATAGLGVSITGCAGRRAQETVVVVGGGFAGATAAKYLRLWNSDMRVVLVEREPSFISCPFSNLVIAGMRTLEQQEFSYHTLQRKYGVKVLHDEVIGIDVDTRTVRLVNGGALRYGRLIVAPGVDFMYERLPGLASMDAQVRAPHAYKAGLQTLGLRRQLESMPDGGVYVLTIPEAPYRCLPAPYERAGLVAEYFKRTKPKSKVIVLDANPEITAKKDLFTQAWNELYPNLIAYYPNHALLDVDVGDKVAKTEFGDFKADVLNVIPPQRAGKVAQNAGALDADKRWCSVDFLTYESVHQKNVHVIGDAVSGTLPKTGHMANNEAKVCAAAVIALLNDQSPIPDPTFANACYSLASEKEGMHEAAVYAYDPGAKSMATVEGSAGTSARRSEIEGRYAYAWAKNIWSDVLK